MSEGPFCQIGAQIKQNKRKVQTNLYIQFSHNRMLTPHTHVATRQTAPLNAHAHHDITSIEREHLG